MTEATTPYPKIELHVHLEATIQPETLLAIAKKFNTTVTAIVKANKLTPKQADALRVGQELVIP